MSDVFEFTDELDTSGSSLLYSAVYNAETGHAVFDTTYGMYEVEGVQSSDWNAFLSAGSQGSYFQTVFKKLFNNWPVEYDQFVDRAEVDEQAVTVAAAVSDKFDYQVEYELIGGGSGSFTAHAANDHEAVEVLSGKLDEIGLRYNLKKVTRNL